MSIERLSDLAAAPRLVLKVGSSLLVGKGGSVREEWIESLAGEIAEARRRGQEVLVVSSGAIALGAAKLGLAKGGRASLADAQAAADAKAAEAQARADAKAQAAAEKAAKPRASSRQTVGEAVIMTGARTATGMVIRNAGKFLGSRDGQRLVRGILGGLLGGRR